MTSTVSLTLVRLDDIPTNDKEIVTHKHRPRIRRRLFVTYVPVPCIVTAHKAERFRSQLQRLMKTMLPAFAP